MYHKSLIDRHIYTCSTHTYACTHYMCVYLCIYTFIQVCIEIEEDSEKGRVKEGGREEER